MLSLFTNFNLISSYIGEILAAGPDAVALVKDIIRAINDYRAGKYTPDEFDAVIKDLQNLAHDLFKTPAPITTTG